MSLCGVQTRVIYCPMFEENICRIFRLNPHSLLYSYAGNDLVKLHILTKHLLFNDATR